jgi:hypothetical protein
MASVRPSVTRPALRQPRFSAWIRQAVHWKLPAQADETQTSHFLVIHLKSGCEHPESDAVNGLSTFALRCKTAVNPYGVPGVWSDLDSWSVAHDFTGTTPSRADQAVPLLWASLAITAAGFLLFRLAGLPVPAIAGLLACELGVANLYSLAFTLTLAAAPQTATPPTPAPSYLRLAQRPSSGSSP